MSSKQRVTLDTINVNKLDTYKFATLQKLWHAQHPTPYLRSKVELFAAIEKSQQPIGELPVELGKYIETFLPKQKINPPNGVLCPLQLEAVDKQKCWQSSIMLKWLPSLFQLIPTRIILESKIHNNIINVIHFTTLEIQCVEHNNLIRVVHMHYKYVDSRWTIQTNGITNKEGNTENGVKALKLFIDQYKKNASFSFRYVITFPPLTRNQLDLLSTRSGTSAAVRVMVGIRTFFIDRWHFKTLNDKESILYVDVNPMTFL